MAIGRDQRASFLCVVILATIVALYPARSNAGVFDQKPAETPKWSRFYIQFGRATGDFGSEAKTFNDNTFGYKRIMGKFSYGGEYETLYSGGSKIEILSATMSLRPDWALGAEPSLNVSYGTAELTSDSDPRNVGRGTTSSIGLSLDLIKGPFYSTSLSAQHLFLNSDASAVKSMTLQTVTFSINVDFY
jgi:hypothetical protein